MAAFSSAPALLVHVLPEALSCRGQQEAIVLLAELLAQRAGLPSAQPLVASALEREGYEPTFIGRGMALPHARVPGLPCAGVCVAHAPAGIPWQGERAELVVFLAVPEEVPELYLAMMSRLVRWRLRLPDEVLAVPTLPAAWEEELAGLLA